jgi:hypothetical protein
MKRIHVGILTTALVVAGSAAAYAAAAGGSGNPIPGGPNPPADKQAIQQLYQARQAAAAGKNTLADKNAAAAQATAMQQAASQDPVSPPTGILDTHEGPFPSSDFVIRNEWQGPVDGNWVAVYAGEILNGQDRPSGQPGLRVYVYKGTWDGAPLSNAYYRVAGAAGGSAKIVGESNDLLTVVSSDGIRSSFAMTSNTDPVLHLVSSDDPTFYQGHDPPHPPEFAPGGRQGGENG